MAPHQQRVLEERNQLQERLTKLLAFFQTPKFLELDEAEQHRMRSQARHMDGYAAVLGERIAAFRRERDAEGAVMSGAEPVCCWKTD